MDTPFVILDHTSFAYFMNEQKKNSKTAESLWCQLLKTFYNFLFFQRVFLFIKCITLIKAQVCEVAPNDQANGWLLSFCEKIVLSMGFL